MHCKIPYIHRKINGKLSFRNRPVDLNSLCVYIYSLLFFPAFKLSYRGLSVSFQSLMSLSRTYFSPLHVWIHRCNYLQMRALDTRPVCFFKAYLRVTRIPYFVHGPVEFSIYLDTEANSTQFASCSSLVDS